MEIVYNVSGFYAHRIIEGDCEYLFMESGSNEYGNHLGFGVDSSEFNERISGLLKKLDRTRLKFHRKKILSELFFELETMAYDRC